MHICVDGLVIIVLSNGLSQVRHQVITKHNPGILSTRPKEYTWNSKFDLKYNFHSRKAIWKCRVETNYHIVSNLIFKQLK